MDHGRAGSYGLVKTTQLIRDNEQPNQAISGDDKWLSVSSLSQAVINKDSLIVYTHRYE